MRTRLLIVSLLAAACLFGAQAAQKEIDADAKTLISAKTFSFGPTGYHGETSDGETAFLRIRAKKNAAAAFTTVFEKGESPARCYALVGLQELGAKNLKELMKEFRKLPPAKVPVMAGCFFYEVELEDILRGVESGAYAEYLRRAAPKR